MGFVQAAEHLHPLVLGRSGPLGVPEAQLGDLVGTEGLAQEGGSLGKLPRHIVEQRQPRLVVDGDEPDQRDAVAQGAPSEVVGGVQAGLTRMLDVAAKGGGVVVGEARRVDRS